MSADQTDQAAAARIGQLEALADRAESIYDELKELDVRSGAVGAARTLVDKIDNAIAFIRKNGAEWDDNERLACNAWRIAQAAAFDLSEDDDTIVGALPSAKLWNGLSDEEKTRWRLAAEKFRK
jgi:hypothetical protein